MLGMRGQAAERRRSRKTLNQTATESGGASELRRADLSLHRFFFLVERRLSGRHLLSLAQMHMCLKGNTGANPAPEFDR